MRQILPAKPEHSLCCGAGGDVGSSGWFFCISELFKLVFFSPRFSFRDHVEMVPALEEPENCNTFVR